MISTFAYFFDNVYTYHSLEQLFLYVAFHMTFINLHYYPFVFMLCFQLDLYMIQLSIQPLS